MKLFLSAICFMLAGLIYSFIPQGTETQPIAYPTLNEITALSTPVSNFPVSNLEINTNLSPVVAQVVIVEDVPQVEEVSQPVVIQPVDEVVSSVPVPEMQQEVVFEVQSDNYDPTLYDEWRPYVEPTSSESVDVWDLDAAWDMVPIIANGFPICPNPLPTPFVTWEMAQRAALAQSDRQNFEQISIQASVVSQIMSEGGGYFPSEGNIRLPENDVMYMLMASGANVCHTNGSIALYGNGVQTFLDNLYNNYKEN